MVRYSYMYSLNLISALSVGSPMKDHQDQDLADEADNLPDSETNTGKFSEYGNSSY